MSDRYCAWIQIGGRIGKSKLEPLIKEICQSSVSLTWGKPPFEPEYADDLLDVLQKGRLWFCDETARNGELPELEETCRSLGLGYQRYCEAWGGFDAEVVDWRPEMSEPLIRTCSNEDSELILVAGGLVKDVMSAMD